MVNALNLIETEYILYFLEDFFLQSPVDVDAFEEAHELIRSDPMIGRIGLKYNESYDFLPGYEADVNERFFDKDHVRTINRINSMTALWRKDWLLSLLRPHETPWEFELYGSVRSRRSPYRVLQINNQIMPPVFHYEVDYQYGVGVSQRRWLPGNKELFAQYDIPVDFEELGWLQMDTSDDPAGPPEKNWRERLYDIKRYYRKIKKWIIRTERKLRSLV